MSKKKIGPLRAIAKKSIQKEIKKQERKQKRKLSREEKIQIKNAVFKKIRTRAAVFGAVGLIGISGIGIGLNSKNNDLKLPAGQTGIELEDENKETARDTFINGIKVEIEQEDNELRENIENEVENLKTPQEVLNYVKGIYAQEYNKNNEEQISVDQISLYKEAVDIVIYEDEAENGDSILRYCTEYTAKQMGKGIDGDKPIISAFIKNEGVNIAEKVALNEKTGKFQRVYSKNQEVKENINTTLENVSELVLAGMNVSISMDKEATSLEVKDLYKERFVDALMQYKQYSDKQIGNDGLENSTNEVER